jgi:hypothetical protein
MQPKPKKARMIAMIQRRTLLSALPFVFMSACARAQPTASGGADMTAPSGDTLASLTGGVGKVAWLTLSGTVRLTRANANVRPAKLMRAIMMTADEASARVFDVWQIGTMPALAAPSVTRATSDAQAGPNDMGSDSLWLNRSFAHPALVSPIEASRLSPSNARVMAIDATQIWLLEGQVTPTPQLDAQALAAFNAWRAA